MKSIARLGLLCLIFLSVGCATVQPPVSMGSEFYESENKSVGVIVQHKDEPEFYMEGDVRLLDFAIIAAATSQLSSHIKTLDPKDFDLVVDEIQAALGQEGFSVTRLDRPVDVEALKDFADADPKDTVYFADKDFSALQSELGVDYLLMLTVTRAGVARGYHGFVPMSGPRAVFELQGQAVELATNKLVWYKHIATANSPRGQWDEPPDFPGLTNSFYVALENAKQRVVQDIKRRADSAPAKSTNASAVTGN